MKYELLYSKDFAKFINKHKNIAPKIKESFELLATNPYDNTLDVKKLQGKESHFRLRISKYCFLYEIINDKLLIYAHKAESRGSVYK
ncbi:type II toxin-antitoxin system RelE/ParE family toxin [Helicobacter fennelliae]|uniref:RelE/StbE replicon stabilization toxin n=2 Tax=Helicobacter fennelliae TaxID=215 RepID=T1CYC7_9HELI|nr:hypothetical protein [Helicobacter fennelliae]GAD17951.1 hypothetical protein HFN_1510 [Helicobacter fennelliae MRY12-0050]SQB99411.1 Uncharacterised protein [Helicobacter fennelliae]STP07630.1 Uncharacterised protein [Helicobacter fennelliae]STQ84954.1 Uncharacterised protein [Helicobacter fennelliae]